MMEQHNENCDLAVIGTGIAGNAAALFARNRGLSVVQLGTSGELLFSSGMFDLLGVNPAGEMKLSRSPYDILDAFRQDFPGHPYARVTDDEIESAFGEMLEFLAGEGIGYALKKDLPSAGETGNLFLPTSLGTFKTSYAVPATMIAGADAFEGRKKCLFVDIKGLKGYSARQISENLKSVWPGHGYVTVGFPGKENRTDIYPEQMARVIEMHDTLRELAERVLPHVNGFDAVAFPAILGIYSSDEVVREMEKILGVPVFEVPTMPPSVPGLRLNEAFGSGLGSKGVLRFQGKKVARTEIDESGFHLVVSGEANETRINARGVILATGRFTGGGLVAGRKLIEEPLFGLHVSQPETRSQWLSSDFFDLKGHGVNRAGIDTDDLLRPLDENGAVTHPSLFAAGSILAHQDWKREKSGSGISIATAFKAVNAYIESSSGR